MRYSLTNISLAIISLELLEIFTGVASSATAQPSIHQSTASSAAQM